MVVFSQITFHCPSFCVQDEEGEEEEDEDEEEGSEIELDEEMHDVSETLFRYDQDDDLVIEFDTMFSSGGEVLCCSYLLNLTS